VYHALRETRSQRRVKIGTDLGKPSSATSATRRSSTTPTTRSGTSSRRGRRRRRIEGLHELTTRLHEATHVAAPASAGAVVITRPTDEDPAT
jgi:hypothetical protein